jgi:cysteine-rich repeat protein
MPNNHPSLSPHLHAALFLLMVPVAACAPTPSETDPSRDRPILDDDDDDDDDDDGVVGDDDDEESTPLPEEWNDIPPCGTNAQMAGKLHTSVSDVAVHASGYATVEVDHRIDVDLSDDGCITRIEVLAQLHAQGCTLQLTLATNGSGYAQLRSASFIADSFCPGFLDTDEGTYGVDQQEAPVWPIDFPIRVPDREAWSSCLPGTVIEFPDHELVLSPYSSGREPLAINLKDLLLYGSLTTTGFPASGAPAACAQFISCDDGMHNGGNGWCAPAGTCAAGYMPALDLPSLCVDCDGDTTLVDEEYGQQTWCLRNGAMPASQVVDVDLPFAEEDPADIALYETRMLRFDVPAGRTASAHISAGSDVFAQLVETTGDLAFDSELLMDPCSCSFFVEVASVDRTFTLVVLGGGDGWDDETSFGIYGIDIDLWRTCGDGFVESDEECDDGNDEYGDGCTPWCTLEEVEVVPPAGNAWTCNDGFFGSSDGCDCGCGIVDPDCSSANVSACQYCNNDGSCATSCAGIDPNNNAVCD